MKIARTQDQKYLAAQQELLNQRATGAARRMCFAWATGPDDITTAYEQSIAKTVNTVFATMTAARGLIIPRKHQERLAQSGFDGARRGLDYAKLPATVLGRAYEALLDQQPTWDGDGVCFDLDRHNRKSAGKFYTPPALVEYVVKNALGPVMRELAAETNAVNTSDRLLSVRVLDPAAGCGDFLIAAAIFIGEFIASLTDTDRQQWVRAAAEQCIYGVDSDAMAIEIARAALWLESATPGDEFIPNEHLCCADSLTRNWSAQRESFHAVIGNPPYVAAKNGGMQPYAIGPDIRGQSDYYLLFLNSILEHNLVRPGGYLSMVLPDPFLVRGNAAGVRRTLVEQWTMQSLLHVKGAFRGTGVSNVIPVCKNSRPSSYEIQVVREDSGSVSSSVSSDLVLAQPGAEILYLTQVEAVHNVFPAVHGCAGAVGKCFPPYQCLGAMDVRIYRGEEVGKSTLSSTSGELPVLLGGQSIQPFGITWEGRRIDRDRIRKPIGNYLADKIILQKSAGRIVAAFDRRGDGHAGYVVPQSIYCIQCGPEEPDYFYLLALLNSSVMNDYVYRAFTGYKLLQPQLEIEDLKRLPIRTISFSTPEEERRKLLARVLVGSESAIGIASYDYAARWLEEGREDLVHDLVVEMVGRLLERTGDTNAAREAVDMAVGLLYGVRV